MRVRRRRWVESHLGKVEAATVEIGEMVNMAEMAMVQQQVRMKEKFGKNRGGRVRMSVVVVALVGTTMSMLSDWSD